MRIFLDTEFLEDGKTIDLISIGMVREDGSELYLVNQSADWRRVYDDPWLMANVVPSLPPMSDSLMFPRASIARRVQDFAGETPEFWAYYADYDWVVLCQLFGRMIDLPEGWPMYCRDFKQLVDQRGLTPKAQESGQHNALEDARWLKGAFEAAK